MAQQSIIIDKVKTLIKPLLEERAVEPVDITYRQEGPRMVLRLLVDKEDGITLDECAILNKEISAILDKDDTIVTSYILEVSSPGLGRPLIAKDDFGRMLGKEMEIFLKSPLRDRLSYVGKLEAVKEDSITLKLEKDEPVKIPLNIINKGKLKIEL